MTTMNVARLVEPGEPLQLGTADVPSPGPTDVVVRVEACGLVPNSYNIVSGRTHHLLPELPAVFGLDAAGTVAALGEHVIGLTVGQRVYVDPYLTCRTCAACRSGRIELCPAGSLRGYFSNTPVGQPLLKRYPIGGLSEFVLAPDRNVVVLPDNVDTTTAARLGYLGTAYAGLARARLEPGKTVLINGVTGTLGVAAVAIALGMGATRILGIGRNPKTLERVRQTDPRRVFTLSSEVGVDPVAWAREHTGGYGVDAMLDCLGTGAGSESTTLLLKAIKPGGRAILVAGGVDGAVTQSYVDTYSDVSVAGSMWFAPREIDELVALVGAGVIDLSYLEHQVFSLDAVNDALEFVGARPGGFTNTVVAPHRSAGAAT